LNSRQLHFQVLRWYKKNARPLPWRRTKNPYRILLSEIMAQQTQIDRVVMFYNDWLKKFPTFSVLANASKADVLRQWSGLGYNSRALRLHALAKDVTENFNGALPRTVDELLQLPGIGKYTAHATACLAFGDNVEVVDVNVQRIYSRLLWNVRSASDVKPATIIWKIARRYLPMGKGAEWNQALMDLGARICTARNPKCDVCPINAFCASAFSKALLKNSTSKKRAEPSFKGIPRRIYRGRILKALHDKPLTVRQIGNRVINPFKLHDLKWMNGILEKMEGEALITIHRIGTRKKVSIAR
jgi:A/G-specific adenine glycosylase